jgi:hypothetical protein
VKSLHGGELGPQFIVAAFTASEFADKFAGVSGVGGRVVAVNKWIVSRI